MIDRRAMVAGTAATLAFTAATPGEGKTMDKRFRQFSAVIEAWKRKDVPFILDAMTDDVVWHYAAAVAPPARGKAEAKAFIDQFGANVGAVRWRIFNHAEDGDRLFLEGVDDYDTRDGTPILAPYAGVIEFRGDKISGWRDYVDRSVIESQRGGAAPSRQVVELSGRPSAR